LKRSSVLAALLFLPTLGKIYQPHFMRHSLVSSFFCLGIATLTTFMGPAANAAVGPGPVQGQDSLTMRQIYDEALQNGHAYDNLRSLCKEVGHRLSGSANAEKAVAWSAALMERYQFDRVRLQPIMVPHWERGAPELCILSATGDTLDVLALGGSVATAGTVQAEVVMFHSLQAIKEAPEGSLTGKIAFLNTAMNAKMIDAFNAYGACANGRVYGPSEAASKGALAFVMRSVGMRADDFPHTGVLHYDAGIDSIPAFALSTNAAFKLANLVREQGQVELALTAHCRQLPDAPSHNVMAELRGTEFPDKVITIGGHLDSWDVGEGAHDDGAGVIQALEVLRLFKVLGIEPRYTIRCVFFMNEENGSRGAKAYPKMCADAGETHFAAMESDRGGFSPRGFHIDGDEMYIEHLRSYLPLFEPYLVHVIQRGYGGVDINPLRSPTTPLIGVVPDSQRYFDVHHTANDVFENVNRRELELGAAGMASLVYLIDKYGFPEKLER
jgi:hypothetical protein